MGLNTAKQKAIDLIEDALTQLEELPHDTYALANLASFVVQRTH